MAKGGQFRVGGSKGKSRAGSYLYVKSYAHAESEGIKPMDSNIDTVVDRKTGKIVGFGQGQTFSERDYGEGQGMGSIVDLNHLKHFDVVFPAHEEDGELVEDEPYKISAINPHVAMMIAREKFNGPFDVYEVKHSTRKVGSV